MGASSEDMVTLWLSGSHPFPVMPEARDNPLSRGGGAVAKSVPQKRVIFLFKLGKNVKTSFAIESFDSLGTQDTSCG